MGHWEAAEPSTFTGTLGGSGTVNRAFTVDSTSILNPGEGTGTLNTILETWAGGGTLKFNLADATGSSGTGWNFLQINSSLNITASPADEFRLDLASLGADGLSGLAKDFDPTKDYSWEIASTTDGITGFNVADFSVEDTEFANSYNGIFSVNQQGDDLFLSYTAAVPEPSTYALLLTGLGILASVRRRLKMWS